MREIPKPINSAEAFKIKVSRPVAYELGLAKQAALEYLMGAGYLPEVVKEPWRDNKLKATEVAYDGADMDEILNFPEDVNPFGYGLTIVTAEELQKPPKE